MSTGEREAGTYASERYAASLHRYRLRTRRYYRGLIVAGTALYLVVFITRGLDWLSFTVGLFSGALYAFALSVKDEPPELIAKWARGAEGEKKTAKAIAPLIAAGWSVRHDVDLGHGNADHVLRSPNGVVYLLETKNLKGTVTAERGILLQRFLDDPLEIRRTDVGQQVKRLAAQVGAEWARRTAHPAPPIHPVVVIWGTFPQETAVHDQVAYVAGDYIESFLRTDEQQRPLTRTQAEG